MYILKNMLYIIGLVIGNIYDLSPMSVYILNNTDYVVVEDKRISGFLLKKMKIKSKILLLNRFNEKKITNIILSKIKLKFSFSLITDSGIPLINDPGSYLLNIMRSNLIKTIIIPGISSISVLLSLSSTICNNFFFKGYLPKKKINKKKFFLYCKNFIFFLKIKNALFNIYIINIYIDFNKSILVGKNLTKTFENIFYFNILEFLFFFKNNKFYGEMIFILN